MTYSVLKVPLNPNQPTNLLWGAPFCGAPVRPNMLNMPKSASASVVTIA